MNRILLLVCLLVLVSGCRKPLPSPDFIEASGRYTNLLAVEGDQSYETSEMDAVVEQLERVKEKSSDYAAARAMSAKITSERARIAKEKEANAKALLAPVTPVNFPTLTPPPVAAPVVAEAPKPVDDPFAVVMGAAWAPIEKKYFGCVVAGEPVTILAADGGSPRSTQSYVLYESADCLKKVPALVQKLALVADGKIIQISAKASVRTVPAPAPDPAP